MGVQYCNQEHVHKLKLFWKKWNAAKKENWLNRVVCPYTFTIVDCIWKQYLSLSVLIKDYRLIFTICIDVELSQYVAVREIAWEPYVCLVRTAYWLRHRAAHQKVQSVWTWSTMNSPADWWQVPVFQPQPPTCNMVIGKYSLTGLLLWGLEGNTYEVLWILKALYECKV